MTAILTKAAKYRRIGTVLIEGEAHLRDPLMPPPQILKPNQILKTSSPDDVTDFPAYKTIPIPESITYREGKYRPPSLPFISGTHGLKQGTSPITLTCNKGKYTLGALAD
jgi:hypothetical protein